MTVANAKPDLLITGPLGTTTVNAASSLWSAYTGVEAKITAAIAYAVSIGAKMVYVPDCFLPYTASQVTFNNAVRMVREGGDPTSVDLKAYGAFGDGVTDDTVAINAWLAAAGAFKGQAFAPAAVYMLRDMWLRSNSTIIGEGQGSTIFRRMPNSIVNFVAVGTTGNVVNAGSAYQVPYTNGALGVNVRMQHLTVDGNNFAQTTWDGAQSGDTQAGAAIHLTYVSQASFEDVEALGALTDGFRIVSCPSPTIVQCRSHDNGTQAVYSFRGNGFHVSGDANDATNPANRQFATLTGCESDRNCDEGFTIGLATDVNITGCRAHDNGNSTASSSTVYGIELTSEGSGATPYPCRVVINGCILANNNRTGSTSNGNGVGVNSANPVQAVIISECSIFNHNGSGINLDISGASVGEILLADILVDGFANTGSTLDGIEVQAGTTTVIKGLELVNCTVRNPLGAARNGVNILCKGSPIGTILGCHLTNITVAGAASMSFGIALQGSVTGFTIASCATTGAPIGIQLSAGTGTFGEGLVQGCYISAATTGVNITPATGTLAGVTVSKNRITGATTGVNLVAAATSCTVDGNDLRGNTTPIADAATNTVKRRNRFSTGPLHGQVTLAAANPAATVNTAEVVAADNIVLSRLAAGGTLGHLSIGAITGGTSFTIVSSGNLDTSVVTWEITH